MLPLFDMLKQAGNGQGVDQIARQFGLSEQQTEAAMEALLPAFSQGLKRNASNADGMGDFLSALASGRHADFFENAAKATDRTGIEEGNGILGHVFGSKDVSRAVASHAAQATGLGEDVLKKMLPALASMIMGGLYQQSTGRVQAAQTQRAQFGGSGGGGLLGEIMEQMMRQMNQDGAASSRRMPRGRSVPSGNPLDQILEGMLGGKADGQRAPSGGINNPLGQIYEEFLRAGRGGNYTPEPQRPVEPQQPQSTPRPAPQANPSGRPRTPYDDLFGEMFETGRKTRDDYERGVENIFEQFRQGMTRR